MPDLQELTDAQRCILAFVVRYQRKHARPPTLLEIQTERGLASSRGVRKHLEALEKKEYVALGRGIRRGLRVLDAAYHILPGEADDRLPLIGRVAAGKPILAPEHIDELIRVDARVFRPRANLLMEVAGESMVGAGILHGDLVAIHLQPEARSGQIVLARVVDMATGDQGITIKTLHTKGEIVYLEAANDSGSYPPTRGRLGDSIFLEGVFCGLMRREPNRFVEPVAAIRSRIS